MKTDYNINIISKDQCKPILLQYHYLTKLQRGFKTKINYGLFKNDILIGICIFTNFPVPELLVGMFGISRNNQEGFYELSRLCLIPSIQETEHNITSWFVAKCIKELKKNYLVRAILSYADNNYHKGIVYQALGFKYYGLTALKKDWYDEVKSGEFVKCSRGSHNYLNGEWRERSRKHRYLIVYDKTLNVKWQEEKYIK